MNGTEIIMSLTAMAVALTPVTLIWLTLRGTTPRQRHELLPDLTEALCALLPRHIHPGRDWRNPGHYRHPAPPNGPIAAPVGAGSTQCQRL
jgi:hypothetical protein